MAGLHEHTCSNEVHERAHVGDHASITAPLSPAQLWAGGTADCHWQHDMMHALEAQALFAVPGCLGARLQTPFPPDVAITIDGPSNVVVNMPYTYEITL